MRWTILLAAACVLAAAWGCDSGRRVAEAGRAEFERQAQAQLDSLDVRIGELRGRAGELTDQARAELEERLGPLERRRDEVREELAELRRMGGEAWRRARAEVERQMAALDSLGERLGETGP